MTPEREPGAMGDDPSASFDASGASDASDAPDAFAARATAPSVEASHEGARQRRTAVAALAATLLVGVALGITADRTVLHPAPLFARRALNVLLGPSLLPEWRRIRGTLRRQLDLSPEQDTRVDSIVTRQIARIDAVRAAVRPDVAAIVSDTRQQIEAVLTPAQRERFEAIRTRLRLPMPSSSAPRDTNANRR